MFSHTVQPSISHKEDGSSTSSPEPGLGPLVSTVMVLDILGGERDTEQEPLVQKLHVGKIQNMENVVAIFFQARPSLNS